MHQQIKTQPLRWSVKLGYSESFSSSSSTPHPHPSQRGGAAPDSQRRRRMQLREKFARRQAAGASDLL